MMIRLILAPVLTPELNAKINSMRMSYALWETGCIRNDEDHGPYGKPYIMPQLDIQRTRIYTGTRKTGSYNHHSQLTKFKGRYYFAFSNGARDEETVGQRIMISSSADGVNWTKAECAIPADAEKGILRNAVGLYASEDELFIYSWTEWAVKDKNVDGMRRIESEKTTMDIFVSKDAKSWEHRSVMFEGRWYMFEAPRMTQGGFLMAAGTRGAQRLALNDAENPVTAGYDEDMPVMYRWDPKDPSATPEIIEMPPPEGGAKLLFGEGSWYQTDDGVTVLYTRDEGQSLRLYVSASEDDGLTWTAPTLSDFPDSMSRVYAGRLSDGRYYVAGNSYLQLLDRKHLMISISDDGYKFDKMYTIIDEPTSMRTKGLLKCAGFQYPCCLADGDKLLVAYSINKEDIECGIINISDL